MITARAREGRTARILFVALLATGVAYCGADDAGEGAGSGAEESGGTASTGAAVDPVDAYRQFAARVQAGAPDAPLDAATVAEGLRQLAGVAGTLPGARPDLATDLRASAEHVLLNPDSVDVAATVTEALTEAGAVVQKTRPAGAAAVQQAVTGLRADTPLPTQSAALRAFFQQVSAALATDGGGGTPASEP